MVGRRHDGSEQSQPVRIAILRLVVSKNSSLLFLAIGRDYSDTPPMNRSGTARLYHFAAPG